MDESQRSSTQEAKTIQAIRKGNNRYYVETEPDWTDLPFNP
jgi:hypothetical protein